VTATIELFYSPVCPYCPEAKRVLIAVAEELEREIEIEEVNVLSSTGYERAEKYGIRGVPTFVINGRVRVMGVPSKEQLQNVIQKELAQNEEK